MRLTIQTTNIEHTEAIDAYVTKKLAELDRLLDPKEREEIARVELAKTTNHHKHGKVFYAEITFHLKKKDFRAAEEGEDLYEAIDLMKDEIIREVKRHRDRSRTRTKEGGREMKRRIRRQK